MEQFNDTTRRQNWKMRLFFGAFIIILFAGSLFLAEIVAGKLYLRLPESGRKAVSSLQDPEHVAYAGYYLQHPYLYYTHIPGYKAGGKVQFNSMGHRNNEVSPEPGPGILRILCIGGSTTVSFPYVIDPMETWPLKLAKLVEHETGIKTEVINAGLNGGNSADLLAHYIFRNRHLKPHIVILHLGGNDATPLLFPEYNPEYTHFTKGWRNAALAPRPFETTWLRFNLVKYAYARWLKNTDLNAQLGRLGIDKLQPADCLRNAEKNKPDGFRRNLDHLISAIIQDGAHPIIFPFVWAPKDVFKKMGDYGPYYDPMTLAFRKNLAVIDEIAEKHKIPTARLPQDAIPPACFKDFCHVNTEGETIKASHMLQYLKPIIKHLIADRKIVQAETCTGISPQ